MRKLNVWVFQTGEPLHIDGEDARPMRAMNLSNTLLEAGHEVVLWSSDFYHQEKRHRYGKYSGVKVMERLEVRVIPSLGYSKNIGVGRLLDHAQLAYRLKRLLKTETEMPDVVFIGYPPIEAAAVLARWCKERNIPTLLDVKDMWPSMFLDALPDLLKPVGKCAFSPYFYLAKRAMRDASGLSSMAPGFLKWALEFSGKKKTSFDAVFPLTTPSYQTSESDYRMALTWWRGKGVEDDGQFKMCFVGSLSPAFDFKPIHDAAKAALENSLDCQFIICGEGGSSAEIKATMDGLPNVIFPGWIDRPKIEALARMCHASLAPYLNVGNFMMNMPNKIVDSLSLGLPILSPLEGEVARLITKYNVGMRYGSGTEKSLYDCICMLKNDDSLRLEMSKECRTLYAEQFAFDVVYGSLVSHLEFMAGTKHDE